MADVVMMSAKHKMSLNPTGQKVTRCFKGPTTDEGVAKFPTFLVDLTAIAGLTLGILAIISSQLFLADLTGYLLICFCPYMSYQKRSLLKLQTFRDALNDMRSHVNDFMRQNNVLTLNINKLALSVNELKKVEDELGKIAGNTDNVERLIEVVTETKRINAEMKKIVEASIIQQMITTIIRTDRNNDMVISPSELRLLMKRLDAKPGFDFNEEQFLNLLGNPKEDTSIEEIMKVIRNLKDHSLSKEKSVFVIKPEQLLEEEKQ